MPQGKHSTIQTECSTTINAVLKPQHIARAFSELRRTFVELNLSVGLIFGWLLE
jgi:Uma2 family endonuclease